MSVFFAREQVTTLSGTVTPIDSSIDSDTGRISLHFPAVAFAESAQSDWSLPGVRPLGMFYFIKVTCCNSQLTVAGSTDAMRS
jgi:hypothetical protein